VTLAGKEYEIEQLNRRASRVWRKSYLAPVMGLAEGVRGLSGVDFANVEDGKFMQMIGGMGGDALDTVLNVLDYDAMFDALCEYSSEIASDRLKLENNDDFYDSEISAAFWALVQMASPFGIVVQYGQRFINLLKSSADDQPKDTQDDQPKASKD